MNDASASSLSGKSEITRQQAERIALKAFSALDRDLVLCQGDTLERPFGWVFFAATRKYLETEDPSYLRPGIGPLAVKRADGTSTVLGTSVAPEIAIEEYERRLQECAPSGGGP